MIEPKPQSHSTDEAMSATAFTYQCRSQLASADSASKIKRICHIVSTQLGFESFFFSLRVPVASNLAERFTATNYPSHWLERYAERDYRSIDPIERHAAEHTIPLDWASIDTTDSPERERLEHFLADAASAGLRSGLTVPIYGTHGERSLLSFATDREPEHTTSQVSEAIPRSVIFATYLHEAAIGVFNEHIRDHQRTLTNRERECLTWIANGKTTAETAALLKIAERTVSFHLQNAVEKLGVNNRSQAVAYAISRRLINPEL